MDEAYRQYPVEIYIHIGGLEFAYADSLEDKTMIVGYYPHTREEGFVGIMRRQG